MDDIRRRVAKSILNLKRLRAKFDNADDDDLKRLFDEIEQELFASCALAEKVETMSPIQLYPRRVAPLFITTCVSLMVAFAILPFEKTISNYATIYAFAPLVSAISGNFGLQTAAIVVRAMALGLIKHWGTVFMREVLTGIMCGLTIGVFAGAVAAITTGYIEALIVLLISLTTGVTTAGFLGCLLPLILERIGLDPAVSGGLETTAQDLASYTTFLAVLTFLLVARS